MSQAKLARELGMTRGNMSHWFSGRATAPGADFVIRAAQLLGVNERWLANGEGPKWPGQQGGKVNKVTEEKQDEENLLDMYRTMDPAIKKMWRRQGRDLLEALGEPSAENPFGKALKKLKPKKRKS